MSKLVQLYVNEIKADRMTIEDVPAGLKSKVEAALSADQETRENEVV